VISTVQKEALLTTGTPLEEWSATFRKIVTLQYSGVEQFLETSGTAHQKTRLHIAGHPNRQNLLRCYLEVSKYCVVD
jgi:hypothetical protein